MKNKSVTTKILSVTLLVVMALAGGLMFVMTYFMNSLTDTIMLNTLQPMAKTAAQSVEGNLHMLADRFFLIRDNPVFVSRSDTVKEKQTILTNMSIGLGFTWLGLYEADGALLVGTDACPRNISGRDVYALINDTQKLAIEETSIGAEGLEVAMGLPLALGGKSGFFLVGSYEYDSLNDVLRNINIGAHGVAFIISDGGDIIGHKDLGKVYSRESIKSSLGAGVESETLLRAMAQGQTGSAEILTPQGKAFVSYAPIRGTLWSMGILAPREDFMDAARHAQFVGALVTVSSLIVFSILFSLFIRRALSIPLRAIAENARVMALGKLDAELPASLTRRNDEIGQLGSAFVTMTQAIQGAIVDIRSLALAARSGNLGMRADHLAYHGDYRHIIAGINAAMATFCSNLDSMPSGLMLLDKNGTALFCNRTMRNTLALHGFSENENAFLAKVLPHDDNGAWDPEIASIFSFEGLSSKGYETEIALGVPDGEKCTYSLSLGRVSENGIADAADDAVCVLLLLNDVTQLTVAKSEAEAASRAKGDFLSRMSHEMRTPMNAIIGMATIGKSANDVERKEYCLDKISEASQHLLGIINDILDMSKIEADKFELSSTEFHFERMLQRVTNVVTFRVDQKFQNFFIDIDKTLPTYLVTDEQRLAQVLANLLSNAVKFTPEEGTIALRIENAGEEDGVFTVRITVTDTGIGISQEQQKRLFTSFEQADGGISRKFGGTGLGLAISKRIVELMEGRIWIESELGKGASFIFEIKAGRGKNEPRKMVSSGPFKELRILAVDDAPEILDLFKSLLTPYGIYCEVAASGEDALQRMAANAEEPFNLVFVDWRMPGMDGVDLTREIVRRYGFDPIVVLVTGADFSEIESAARAAGAKHFLQKPLFPSMLADCINECMHQRREPDVAEEPEAAANVFAGKKLLLVEDVEINREIAMALLEHTGIEISCAYDGQEAIDAFAEDPEKYDAILMDVHMPMVDGYEATERIRASGLPRAGAIPIIAMTANVFREDVERCLEAGMNNHLGKPIDPEEVIIMLKRYIG